MKKTSLTKYIARSLMAVAVLSFSFAVSAPADAKIRCKGPFQIIKGVGHHATPYCQDNYLARIARSYGWKVGNRSVRNNPSLKARICRQIGHDNRLIAICSNSFVDGARHGNFR